MLAVSLLVLSGSALWLLWMPGRNPDHPLAPLDARAQALRDSLESDVRTLSQAIGERNAIHPDAYARAADWIHARFASAGLHVEEQRFRAAGGIEVRNVVAEVRGSGKDQRIIVVGAHYDSAQGTPGANDNASGVAALLALASRCANSAPVNTVRFVAFANEEPPYFEGDQTGSLVYARRCAAAHEDISAMLSLETLGAYSDAPGSQRYPFPLNLFYPSRGNFIAFVGNPLSRSLTRAVVASFRGTQQLPAIGSALPERIPGVGGSDHGSFWQLGAPAVMVTDTAFLRDADYHRSTDTPDKLEYGRFARAVTGLVAVLDDLSHADR